MGALEGKIAVVTGATSGSGLGIARRFVEEGATVLLLARGGDRLERTATDLGPRAIPLLTDVGDPGSVDRTFAEVGDRFGRVDILVNNAAVYRPCRVELLSDLDIEQQMRTNFAGPVYTCRAAIPLLRAAGGGDIVNTSSESTLHPFPMLSMYVATKAPSRRSRSSWRRRFATTTSGSRRSFRAGPTVRGTGRRTGSGIPSTARQRSICGRSRA